MPSRHRIERLIKKSAARHNINPAIFRAQLKAESGLNPNAHSPAGASGIAQFMPGTAPSYGVNLHDGKVRDDIEGAAKMMSSMLQRFGGSYKLALAAYNAGPGAAEHALTAYPETRAYVQKILASAGTGGGNPKRHGGDHPVHIQGAPRIPGTPGQTNVGVVQTQGYDPTADRQRLVKGFALGDYGDPRSSAAKAALISAITSLKPGSAGRTQIATSTTGGVPGTRGVPGGTVPGARGGSSGGPGKGGASRAVSWAQKNVGMFKESNGFNRGPRLDKLEHRFGMTGQAWCAMFTSAAATRGGMAASGRTASVKSVRDQATVGSAAYEKGFKAHAKAGDLILFGNDHIGMVESVDANGTIHTIEGNTSSGRVARVTRAPGSGDLVRPKYR